MDAEITVQSTVGEGSRFSLIFPRGGGSARPGADRLAERTDRCHPQDCFDTAAVATYMRSAAMRSESRTCSTSAGPASRLSAACLAGCPDATPSTRGFDSTRLGSRDDRRLTSQSPLSIRAGSSCRSRAGHRSTRDAVIADGSNRVLSGTEVTSPVALMANRSCGTPAIVGAIPHVVEPRRLTRERRRATNQCREGVRVRWRIVGAVTPCEEANVPVDRGLEPSIRETRRRSAGGSAADVLQRELPVVLASLHRRDDDVSAPSAPMRPLSRDTRAMPRRPITRQRPPGRAPVTRAGWRASCRLGQTNGVRQSYGPHSVTMMAERRARERVGAGLERTWHSAAPGANWRQCRHVDLSNPARCAARPDSRVVSPRRARRQWSTATCRQARTASRRRSRGSPSGASPVADARTPTRGAKCSRVIR